MDTRILDTKIIDQKFLEDMPSFDDTLVLFIMKQLNELSCYYPDFAEWLNKKVVPGIYSGERSILLEHTNHRLSGIAIIKDTAKEKKLCCLRVIPPFQGTGVGLRLFERSFNALECSNPLLSIAEEQTHNFQKIFKYYGFELAKVYQDYYRPHKKELSFNGLIISPEQLHRSPKLVVSQ